MGYDQYATITVKSKSLDLMIHNVRLVWGKFCECRNRDKDVSISTIEGVLIPKNNGGFTFETCGVCDAPSGTEGSFDVYASNVLVGHYYWECPYGSKTNTSTWTPKSEDYIGCATGGHLNGGPLADVTISIGMA